MEEFKETCWSRSRQRHKNRKYVFMFDIQQQIKEQNGIDGKKGEKHNKTRSQIGE